MPLDYLKSDIIRPVQTSQVPSRKKKKTQRGFYVKLFVLIVILVMSCSFSYNLWAPKVVAKTTKSPKGLTAIIHDAEKPSAVINGQIVYIGDSVGKSKIVDIEANCVTLEKNQKTYQMVMK
jgi:hypothetical protein